MVYMASRPAAPAERSEKVSKQNRDVVAAQATAGDHDAELQMGIWALESAVKSDDFRKAEEWLRKSAESGNAEAEYRLGTLYQSARVTDPGKTNALFWFQKAAAQHHVGALFNLGSMYGTGQGVARDPQAAIRFFREAAELGDAYAQFNMARRCSEGQGMATNLVEGWKWYELAEAGGIASAHAPKLVIESRMTAAELEQARRGVEEVRARTATSHK